MHPLKLIRLIIYSGVKHTGILSIHTRFVAAYPYVAGMIR